MLDAPTDEAVTGVKEPATPVADRRRMSRYGPSVGKGAAAFETSNEGSVTLVTSSPWTPLSLPGSSTSAGVLGFVATIRTESGSLGRLTLFATSICSTS